MNTLTILYKSLQYSQTDIKHNRSNLFAPNGKELVGLTNSENGGLVEVGNKTGATVVTLLADEYGNGVVYAGNRKGKGRTLKPGP